MNIDKSIKIQEEIARFEEMKNYFSVDFEKGLIIRLKKYGTSGFSKIGDIIKRKNIQGYIVFQFQDREVKAHRFIFYYYHGELFEIIDHINGIKNDNSISNLRGDNDNKNQQNQRKPQIGNTTGYLGVCWNKLAQKYKATIAFNGKNNHLGYFSTKELAYEAYLTAKRINHEFCTI